MSGVRCALGSCPVCTTRGRTKGRLAGAHAQTACAGVGARWVGGSRIIPQGTPGLQHLKGAGAPPQAGAGNTSLAEAERVGWARGTRGPEALRQVCLSWEAILTPPSSVSQKTRLLKLKLAANSTLQVDGNFWGHALFEIIQHSGRTCST